MRVNGGANFGPVVAALLFMYGRRVDGGWYEVFIPADIIGSLSSTGEIQQAPSVPTEPGWRFRYRESRQIEGTIASTAVQAPPESPEPEIGSPPHLLDEWA